MLVSFLLVATTIVTATGQGVPSFQVTKTGTGTTNIILLQGFACSPAVWNQTVLLLSKTSTCYTFHFSGYAGTRPQAQPEAKRWEADIISFIKDSNIMSPVIIGHSLGGTMALEIAIKDPSLFSRIVIIDAFPCLAATGNPAFQEPDSVNCIQYIRQFTQMNEEQFYTMQKGAFAQMLADTTKLATLLNWSVRSDRKTLGTMLCHFSNIDLRNKLASIKSPTLVLFQPGLKAADAMIKLQYALLPGAQIKYSTKGLHFIMYDDEEWYLRNLESFLQQ